MLFQVLTFGGKRSALGRVEARAQVVGVVVLFRIDFKYLSSINYLFTFLYGFYRLV